VGSTALAKRRKAPEPHPLATLYDPSKTVWTQGERRALVQRTMDGDKSALPELRAMLDAHPETVKSLSAFLMDAGVSLVRDNFAGDARALPDEVFPRQLKLLRADLEGDAPTPLERLLCERVATCYLATQILDTRSMLQIGWPVRVP